MLKGFLENRFPSYIGLGLYWEYEGTTWLQDACHSKVYHKLKGKKIIVF